MNGTLILIRHGESLWNAKNVWTGITDIGLSDKGKIEAAHSAQKIMDLGISHAFTSNLSRAVQTLDIILGVLHKTNIPVVKSGALNERDYGIYTGKNKTDIKNELGEPGYTSLRRGWDWVVPEGENLKQVYDRVVPYYTQSIEPHIVSGKQVLIVAHGNSLRALMKYIEHISDKDIELIELKTGEIVLYTISPEGVLMTRETLSQERVLG